MSFDSVDSKSFEEIKKIKEEVLRNIKPSKEELKKELEIFGEIKDYIKKEFGIEARLMGSVAKKTFIKGNKDLDIFVFFDPNIDKKELEKKALELGKKTFEHFNGKYVVAYAEHPYTKGIIRGFDVEIVPAYNIRDTKKLKSAVDRTPFHTEYIKRNLKNHDDVIILKQFLKSNNIYGSELKTKGFSGYLCELLIVKYGTFENLLKESLKWRNGEIVYLNKIKETEKTRKMFKGHPFVFVDPVDPNRNVAAVLSLENYAIFRKIVIEFLQKPSIDFFKEKEHDKHKILKKIKKYGATLYVLMFRRPELIDDILYPQLERMNRKLVDEMRRNGFNVLFSFVFGDNNEIGICLVPKEKEISKIELIKGPRVWIDKTNLTRFLEAHENVFIVDDTLHTLKERKFTDVGDFINNIIVIYKKKYRELGVPEYLKYPSKIIITSNPDIKIKEFWDKLGRYFS